MSARATRRQLFGAPAAMLLVGSAGAGEAKAAELDRELLDACARFHATHKAREATGLPYEEYERLDENWEGAIQAVCDLSPRTPEGLQARANVAATVMRWRVKTFTNQTWDEQANIYEWLAIDCLSDVAGTQGGSTR